jgi:hypothetical protein
MSIKLFIFFMNVIKVMPLPNVNLVITTHEDYLKVHIELFFIRCGIMISFVIPMLMIIHSRPLKN